MVAEETWPMMEDKVFTSIPCSRAMVAKLIQTGQNNWPIAVLLALGVVVMAAGVVMISRKRKRNG